MPKTTIDISDVDNKKLKILALKNGRTLKQFIPRFIHECLEKNIVELDEQTGEFIISNTSTFTSQSSDITLAQLKELGVQDIKIKNAEKATLSELPELPELPEQYDNIKTSFTPEELIEERRKVKKRNEDIAHFMNIVYTHTRLSRKHDINYIFDSDSSFVVLWPDTDLYKKCPHPVDYGINEYNVDTKKVRYAYSLPDDVLINEYCPDLDHYIDANGDIKINK